MRSVGSSNAEFAQVTLSLTMPYSKKRSWKQMAGKGKGSGGPAKKKSLTATVSALAKIVKKDHSTIAKSIDYADYFYSANNAAVPYELFYGQSILFPVNWTQTCRRSNNTQTSPEATLKNLRLSICCNHGTTIYAITWYVALVRAKKDWIPSTLFGNALRTLVDYSDMGFGNAPVLNYDKFTILKQFKFETNLIGQGNPGHSHVQRSCDLKMNYTMRASVQNSTTADANWFTNIDTDFATSDRLYVLTYCNTPAGVNWSSGFGPSMFTGARFTTSQL